MKFILKHGKSEKDIQNLRQEIEVFTLFSILLVCVFVAQLRFLLFADLEEVKA